MGGLNRLQEATRPRLNAETVTAMRDHAEFLAVGDNDDRRVAAGIELLLDMHDRLEAIRHGQA